MTSIDTSNDEDVAAEELLSRLDASPAHLENLHERLARDAASADMLDVAYVVVESPVGPLLLAATERGLVRVAFEIEGFDAVLEAIAAKVSSRVLRAPQRLDAVRRELDEYFARDRTTFDLPLDFGLSGGFRERVQHYLPSIGYGRTESYGAVARAVGNPKAVRAVGTACAKNPLPVVVPCHRVLRSDGTLGGYAGGLANKTTLLEFEAAA